MDFRVDIEALYRSQNDKVLQYRSLPGESYVRIMIYVYRARRPCFDIEVHDFDSDIPVIELEVWQGSKCIMMTRMNVYVYMAMYIHDNFTFKFINMYIHTTTYIYTSGIVTGCMYEVHTSMY